MNILKNILLIFVISLFSNAALAGEGEEEESKQEEGSFKDNVFVGGNLGFSFGNDITIINVSPNFGYRVTDDLSVGIGVLYQYRNDKRFEPEIRSNDYGGSVFARYQVFEPFFAQLEFEYLNFEFPFVISPNEFSTDREAFTSVFIGGGVNQPIGRNAFFNVTVLYNVTYDDDEIPRPYNSPIVVRGGVTIGF
ncbi:MAG: hypothetical protein AAF363_05995 [Bacteroidota bacterium]